MSLQTSADSSAAASSTDVQQPAATEREESSTWYGPLWNTVTSYGGRMMRAIRDTAVNTSIADVARATLHTAADVALLSTVGLTVDDVTPIVQSTVEAAPQMVDSARRVAQEAQRLWNGLPVQRADTNQPSPRDCCLQVQREAMVAARVPELPGALHTITIFTEQLLDHHGCFLEDEHLTPHVGEHFAPIARTTIIPLLRWQHSDKFRTLMDTNLNRMALNFVNRFQEKLSEDPHFLQNQIVDVVELGADHAEALDQVYSERRANRNKPKGDLMTELSRTGVEIHPGVNTAEGATQEEVEEQFLAEFARPLSERLARILLPEGPRSVDLHLWTDPEMFTGVVLELTPETKEQLQEQIYELFIETALPEALSAGFAMIFDEAGNLKPKYVDKLVIQVDEAAHDPNAGDPTVAWPEQPHLNLGNRLRVEACIQRIGVATGHSVLPQVLEIGTNLPGMWEKANQIAEDAAGDLTSKLTRYGPARLLHLALKNGVRAMHPGHWVRGSDGLVHYLPQTKTGEDMAEFDFTRVVAPEEELAQLPPRTGPRQTTINHHRSRQILFEHAGSILPTKIGKMTETLKDLWSGLHARIDRVAEQLFGDMGLSFKHALDNFCWLICIELPQQILAATGVSRLFKERVLHPIIRWYENKVLEVNETTLQYTGELINKNLMMQGMERVLAALEANNAAVDDN